MPQKTRTVCDVLTEFKKAHEKAHEEIYHMLLCEIGDPFTQYFIRKGDEKTSFVDEIAEQIILQKDLTQKSNAYYKGVDFLSEVSEEVIKTFNEQNTIFTLFLKDPSDKNRQVTITLK